MEEIMSADLVKILAGQGVTGIILIVIMQRFLKNHDTLIQNLSKCLEEKNQILIDLLKEMHKQKD